MNPTGDRWDPRLCVNSLSSQHWTLSEDLECYERLGIGRISLFMPKLLDMRAGIDRAEAEIKAGGFRVDGILPGSSFDLLDEASWSRTRDALVLGIEVAAEAGRRDRCRPWEGQPAGGPTSGGRPVCPGHRPGRAQLQRRQVSTWRSSPPGRSSPTSALCTRCGTPWLLAADLGLWVVADTAHSLVGAQRGGPPYTGSAPGIAVLQVADLAFRAPVLERLVPGDGAIALRRLLSAMLDAGFSGPFELEILGSAIENEGYEKAMSARSRYPDQPPGGSESDRW